jgi:Type-1V conjugative transfer system mating pair stabilisation
MRIKVRTFLIANAHVVELSDLRYVPIRFPSYGGQARGGCLPGVALAKPGSPSVHLALRNVIRTITLHICLVCLLPFFAEGSSIRSSVSWRAIDGRSGIANCRDSGKVCLESGARIVEGIKVSRPCWKYGYQKTCDFPSKNDCHLIAHCYEVGLKECLMYDQFNNCVNQKKEFSCKRREMMTTDREKLKQKLKGDEARKIVCKGVPCIDGNCVDKSYDMDEDMMKSVSQLYAASQAKGAKDMSFKLFQGFDQHCTKKPVGYMSCCKVQGWGAHLGASCGADEKKLHDLRVKNLCVYAVKETTGMRPIHTNKHHFCCFGNILNKVFQVEARKQLVPHIPPDERFRVGDKSDCRGLTLEEITSLDFEKMDFSEFILEMKKRMKVPNVGDIHMRASGTAGSIKDRSERPATHQDPELKKAGVNEPIMRELGNEGEYAK